jgi:ribosomal 50S subunit-recycling heat shock protein
MKKVLMMALTVVISLAFVTVVFAQAPAGTPEQKTTTTTTTPEKKETTTTTETTKSKAMRFRGKVTAMDTAAKTMTVKGKKGDMTFDVSSAKMKDEVKAGDMVRVRYTEKDGKMMASWVTMHRAKTTKTTTTKTTEKKEETTTPAAPAK